MRHQPLSSILGTVLLLGFHDAWVKAETGVCTRQNVSRVEDRIPYGPTSHDCVGSS